MSVISKKTKNLLFFAKFLIILGAVLAIYTGNVFAATTPPAITSGTYDVSTGKLDLICTDLAAVNGSANDVDPKFIRISNGDSKIYTLKSPKVDRTSEGSVSITLTAADKTGILGVIDSNGTLCAAGTDYNITVLKGWNGPTSKTDLGTHPLTVSNLGFLLSATYDMSKGSLVLTGTGLLNGKVDPKKLTITNNNDKLFTLKSSAPVTATSATSVTITVAANDQVELAKIFDKNGTSDCSLNVYNIEAAQGWVNTSAVGNVANANAVTVSGYAKPVASLASAATVKLGSPAAGCKSDKAGTLYLIPSDTTSVSSLTVNALDAMVTAGSAVKATCKANTAVSIPTKTLTLSTTSAAFSLIAVDTAGGVSTSLSTNGFTITNIAAPAITTATMAAGSATDTTKITITTGSSFCIVIDDATIAIPTKGTTQSAITGAVNYTSGTDIKGADLTNKYIGLYELDSSLHVVKFKLFTCSATSFNALSTGPSLKSISVDSAKTKVSLAFDQKIFNATASADALKAAISATPSSISISSVAISTTTPQVLEVTLGSALTTTSTIKLTIKASTLKNLKSVKNAAITTGNIDANGGTTAPAPAPDPVGAIPENESISSVTGGGGPSNYQWVATSARVKELEAFKT